jgi:hypothetical protein
MTITDICNSLVPLLTDTSEAEENLEKQPDSPFARRVYIRSVFAYIEGAVWILKDACLHAKPKVGTVRKVSSAEVALLQEESYQLKENGSIRITKMNLNLVDNIKFTFQYINHLFTGTIDLQLDKEIGTHLKVSKEIRNRLAHPKQISDLTISDKEIELCQKVAVWFNVKTQEAIELMIKSGITEN